MKLTKKSVASILTGAALSLTAPHASAIGYAGQLTFDRTVDTTFNSSLANSTAAPVKNWADMAIDLGWMHTTRWFTLHVASAGDTLIKLTDASTAYTTTTATTSAVTGNTTTTMTNYNGNTSNMAFSIWSFAGAAGLASDMTSATNPGGDPVNNPSYIATPVAPTATHYVAGATNNSMGYNQVAAPDPANNSNFLAAGGVNGFVGYANSGDTFTNGNGNFVGNGSAGSSVGTDANGHKFASLQVNGLAAGDYLIALGGSCINLTNCGNEALSKQIVVTNTLSGAIVSDTTTLNPAKTWGLANYNLTVTAVPVPGAVWLFGSAMAGMIGFGRRKQARLSA